MGELLSLLLIPAAGGAAWAGVKSGLNGARQSIVQIEKIVSRLDEKVAKLEVGHGERITAIEVETSNLRDRAFWKERK